MFDPIIARTVVEKLSEGTPLTVICREGKKTNPDFPCDETVRNWAKEDADFALDIAGARDAGHDAIAARTRETSRGRGDSSGDVQRDKLIIDTDLKLLAKWNPKKYGDRMAHVGGNPDEGDRPISHAVEATVVFKRPGE